MAVNKTSDDTKRNIKRKTAYAMPDRPSEKGMKAEDVKKAFWAPLLDGDDSILSEVDRVVDEVNADLAEMGTKVNALEETTFKTDNATTNVDYTFVDNEFKSFVAANIENVVLTIPETVAIGFSAGVTVKYGSAAPTVYFVNNSDKTLKKLQFCSTIETYQPTANSTCKILVDCDEGDTVCVWIVEVQ